MKSVKRLIKLFVVLSVFFGCNTALPEFDDFDYTAVYFPIQYPIRTLSLGEEEFDNSLDKELKFHIAPNIGGMYENRKTWTVDFVIDENLAKDLTDISGNPLKALPQSYYSLSPAGRVEISPGSFKGMIQVQLNEDFLDDPMAFKTHYVIPLRIIASSADSILTGEAVEGIASPDPRIPSHWVVRPRNFVLFGIKYVNPYHGTYLHHGRNIRFDQNNNPVDTAVYRQIYLVNNPLYQLTTEGKNVVHTNGISSFRGAIGGQYKMELTFADNGDIVVGSLPGARWATSGTGKYVVGGGEWGQKPRDAIYLSYQYQDGNNRHQVTDTLIFRNRGLRFEEFVPRVTGVPDEPVDN
jgi:hypothetical protein